MRRPLIGLVVALLIAGVAAALAFYGKFTFPLVFGVGIGGGLGAVGAWWIGRSRPTRANRAQPDPALTDRLLSGLLDMGDVLQEVSIDNLQRRGSWDQALFTEVLNQVEQQVPPFQQALIRYLAQDQRVAAECVTALLAVDRLSAAYTYWTRLFPPRQPDESMFVLSLLQDLSEKVEYAISVLGD